MFERIVVGVSQVATAKEAARHAIDLASKLGAELHLVVAFDNNPNAPGRERDHAEGFLESVALTSGLTTHTHAMPGDPAAAILQVAEQVDADLIVVGNKGMRGAGRILGSVPNNIAHKASCSVLIVNTT